MKTMRIAVLFMVLSVCALPQGWPILCCGNEGTMIEAQGLFSTTMCDLYTCYDASGNLVLSKWINCFTTSCGSWGCWWGWGQ